MKVAITEYGRAYALPDGLFTAPVGVRPPKEGHSFDKTEWFFGGRLTVPDDAELIARVTVVPDSATHYDMVLHAPAGSFKDRTGIEEKCPWVQPIIGRPPAPPGEYKVHKTTGIGPSMGFPGEYDEFSELQPYQVDFLRRLGFAHGPKHQWQWLKDTAAFVLVLLAYAMVLTVAARMDDWPLWVSGAALAFIVVGLVGLGSLIARLRGEWP